LKTTENPEVFDVILLRVSKPLISNAAEMLNLTFDDSVDYSFISVYSAFLAEF
jgi:hypothetical protein